MPDSVFILEGDFLALNRIHVQATSRTTGCSRTDGSKPFAIMEVRLACQFLSAWPYEQVLEQRLLACAMACPPLWSPSSEIKSVSFS